MATTSRSVEAGPAAFSPGDAASIPVAGPRPAVPDPDSPEQQLTHALAGFQAEVSSISSADLAAVVEAARPAFRRGLGWSAHLREQQGRSRLRVTLMHVAGAELCSESWADETSDLTETTGLMLAMLLGIPVSQKACTPEPCSSPDLVGSGKPPGEIGLTGATSSVPEPVTAGRDPALSPLTEAEIEATHQRILALPQAARQELTKAFREHFQVPRQARSIGDRITQHQHAAFIEHFLEEAQPATVDGAQSPAEP